MARYTEELKTRLSADQLARLREAASDGVHVVLIEGHHPLSRRRSALGQRMRRSSNADAATRLRVALECRGVCGGGS